MFRKNNIRISRDISPNYVIVNRIDLVQTTTLDKDKEEQGPTRPRPPPSTVQHAPPHLPPHSLQLRIKVP